MLDIDLNTQVIEKLVGLREKLNDTLTIDPVASINTFIDEFQPNNPDQLKKYEEIIPVLVDLLIFEIAIHKKIAKLTESESSEESLASTKQWFLIEAEKTSH